jgi:hypothetical protein
LTSFWLVPLTAPQRAIQSRAHSGLYKSKLVLKHGRRRPADRPGFPAKGALDVDEYLDLQQCVRPPLTYPLGFSGMGVGARFSPSSVTITDGGDEPFGRF